MGIFGRKRQLKYDFEIPSNLEPCGNRVILPARFPHKFAGCLNEAEWSSIRRSIDMVVNGEQTFGIRKIISQAHRRIYLCMFTITLGFLIGFLCTILGGTTENYSVMGFGVAFIGVFILSLVVMIQTSLNITKLSSELVDRVFQTLSISLVPELRVQHPMLQFEIVHIGRKNKICNIRVRPVQGLSSYTPVTTGVTAVYTPAMAAPVMTAVSAQGYPQAAPPMYAHNEPSHGHPQGVAPHMYPQSGPTPQVVVTAYAEPVNDTMKPGQRYYNTSAV